jgi:Sec-independent protein translocase protein TatA
MEFLGIGPLELFFILIIALIILGPGDMVKAGRTIGRFLRKVVTSPEWRTVQKASREIKYLPNRLMREASLEDLSKDFQEFNKIGGQLNNDLRQVQSDLSSWTTPPELRSPNKGDPETPPVSAPVSEPVSEPVIAPPTVPDQAIDPEPEDKPE